MSFLPTSSCSISNIGRRQLLSRRSPTSTVSRKLAERVCVVESHSVRLRSAKATKSATCCPSTSTISTNWPARATKAVPCPPGTRISCRSRYGPGSAATGWFLTLASSLIARIVRHIQWRVKIRLELPGWARSVTPVHGRVTVVRPPRSRSCTVAQARELRRLC